MKGFVKRASLFYLVLAWTIINKILRTRDGGFLKESASDCVGMWIDKMAVELNCKYVNSIN